MYLGNLATLTLDASAGLVASAAGTEINLQKYFVNPGKRPMEAVVCAIWTASDSGTATFDYKLQESNTTVDSDFSDISGAAITQVAADVGNTFQTVPFFTAKQYIRGYHTTVAGVWTVAAAVLTSKRDG